MASSTWLVTGMTCGHCVQAVTSEISVIEGVESVDVDLASGRVQIQAEPTPSRLQVAEAVDEAGYALA